MTIKGFELGIELLDKGLVPKDCHRVVIDIPVDGLVKIYYATYDNSPKLDDLIKRLLVEGTPSEIPKREEKTNAQTP